MSDIEAAFIDDIIANPDDDTPRLVYADWLEMEKGEADRAEFIRLQMDAVKVGQMPAGWPLQGAPIPASFVGKTAWRPWNKEGAALTICFGESGQTHELTFSRGFIKKVVTTSRGWEQHGPAICAAHPVTRVELIDARPVVGADGANWLRGEDGYEMEPSELPPAVWHLLEGRPNPHAPEWAKQYDTEALANDDLSRALIAWARKPVDLAGKIPCPFPEDEPKLFGWMREPEGGEYRDTVPPTIFALLDGHTNPDDDSWAHWKTYPTERLALDALARAIQRKPVEVPA